MQQGIQEQFWSPRIPKYILLIKVVSLNTDPLIPLGAVWSSEDLEEICAFPQVSKHPLFAIASQSVHGSMSPESAYVLGVFS